MIWPQPDLESVRQTGVCDRRCYPTSALTATLPALGEGHDVGTGDHPALAARHPFRRNLVRVEQPDHVRGQHPQQLGCFVDAEHRSHHPSLTRRLTMVMCYFPFSTPFGADTHEPERGPYQIT